MIAVTPGEPAGIGPDILCELVSANPNLPIVLIADPLLMQERAEKLGLRWPQKIRISPVKMAVPCKPGQADTKNVPYVLETLSMAHEGCRDGTYQALVTGPVHKGLINDAGIHFVGHTQFLAELNSCNTLMLFVTPLMKVALATTHIPLKEVPKKITGDLIFNTVKLVAADLEKYFSIKNPRISVCGINPHAGEGGHMGTEEVEVLIPALNKLRDQNYMIIGPVPADTAFTENNVKMCDAILAMYHDQALPVIKAQSFSNAVNVTLGLPYLRTSVDHGTAFELAGTGRADSGSFKAALDLAIKLTSN